MKYTWPWTAGNAHSSIRIRVSVSKVAVARDDVSGRVANLQRQIAVAWKPWSSARDRRDLLKERLHVDRASRLSFDTEVIAVGRQSKNGIKARIDGWIHIDGRAPHPSELRWWRHH